MEYQAVGRSGLRVSQVGLGCNNFGRQCDFGTSRDIVHAALDAGITLFDTANVYGHGRSEEFLGQALKGLRQDVVIATKFGVHPGDGDGTDRGRLWIRAARGDILRAISESLRRLGTDYVDLFQLHWPDPGTPIDEILATLDSLVRAGKVRYVGHSNFAGWQVVEAHYRAQSHNWTPFISSQSHYNLLHRNIEAEVVPACQACGLSVLPYFPLASGFLTGKYDRNSAPPARSRLGQSAQTARKVMSAKNWELVEKLRAFAAERGRSLTDLALGWLAGRPPVASVITGATTAAQIRGNVAAAAWRLTADDMAEVDKLSARPG
jgi:aryl-alcohol dehydrogenase-like predicted oxidoreductase